MKKQIQKDKKIRKLFNQKELNHLILKSIVKNENLSLIVKWNAISKLSNFSRNQNKTRFVNRCILTNRKAKFNRIFKKFSRLSFLCLARSGVIPGLKKSSW
jgi:ribosomal protein S14